MRNKFAILLSLYMIFCSASAGASQVDRPQLETVAAKKSPQAPTKRLGLACSNKGVEEFNYQLATQGSLGPLGRVFYIEFPKPDAKDPRPECGVYIFSPADPSNAQQKIALTSEDFFSVFSEDNGQFGSVRDGTLVHLPGHATTAADALPRVIKFRIGSNFQGPAIVVDWPTGIVTDYKKTKKNRKKYLEKILLTLQAVHDLDVKNRLHVWGHSHGALLAVETLSLGQWTNGYRKPIFNLILEAPDVRFDQVFANTPILNESAKRITIYCANNDVALKLPAILGGKNEDRMCAKRSLLKLTEFVSVSVDMVDVTKFVRKLSIRTDKELEEWVPRRLREERVSVASTTIPPAAIQRLALRHSTIVFALFTQSLTRSFFRFNHNYFEAEILEDELGHLIRGNKPDSRPYLMPSSESDRVWEFDGSIPNAAGRKEI